MVKEEVVPLRATSATIVPTTTGEQKHQFILVYTSVLVENERLNKCWPCGKSTDKQYIEQKKDKAPQRTKLVISSRLTHVTCLRMTHD
ncbi:hypothetical protein J6590_031714 [Homalodisca vitripennis]|nr:hypothetical protein J6590_031714 [Homalodisca vitripennis]